MRSIVLRVAFFALLGVPPIAGAAFAQPAAKDDDATIIVLSQRVEKAVARDLLTAELRTEAAGADPAKLQAAINRSMEAALAKAKQAPGVSVETMGYSVYQVRSGQAVRWQASQGLRLRARDFGALLGLVGALQETGLALSDLSPSVSPEAVARIEDELTNEALARLKRRAEAIAAILGEKIARYRELRIGNATTQGIVRPMATLARAASSSSAPPVVEAGDATVSLTIDATIALTAPR